MSEANGLHLAQLHVRRTPGIDEAFLLDDLSPAVNVVHGPNGSGKSSTAAVIEAVLWPERERAASVAARGTFTCAGSAYVIDVDAGRTTVQKDGAVGEAPARPAAELRQCYRLSLHQLLRATDGPDGLAAAIVTQSRGGVDLVGAAKQLGFRDRASACTTELGAYDKARAALKTARDEQESLFRASTELAALDARAEASKAAGRRERTLAAAVRHAKAAATFRAEQTRCDALPAVLGALRGDEHERWSTLAEQLRAAQEREERATAAVHAADRAAAEALPGGVPARESVATLQLQAATLTQLGHDVTNETRAVHAAVERLDATRRTIGPALSDAQLAAIRSAAVDDLTSFAEEAERLDAEIAVASAEADRYADHANADDAGALRSGIDALLRWLEEGATSERLDASRAGRRRLLLALALVGALGWIVGAVFAHPAAAIGAFVVAMLAWIAWRDAAPGPDGRQAREQDYARSGLPRPEAWTRERVAPLLAQLQTRLAAAVAREERTAWARDARRRLDELETRRHPLEARRVELVHRFGFAPDTGVRRLAWLLGAIGRWQTAWVDYCGARGRLEATETQRDVALGALRSGLAPLGLGVPGNAAEALGGVEAIGRRIAAAERAIADAGTAAARRGDAQRECTRLRADMDEISARAELGAIVDPVARARALEQLCGRVEEHGAATDALRIARHALAEARSALTQEGAEESLFALPVDVLEGERLAADTEAAASHALVERAASLRALVERAKQQSDVERALGAVAAAEDALRVARSRDVEAMVGKLLADYVHDTTRDRHRPRVFHRASELFEEITRGRYTLSLHEGADAADARFRAIDTTTTLGHALDELSSATQVQLLLAVRMAFVEVQEQGGARLPLLLDETLGTSDDVRARAVIDAVGTLARGGRQIFYFTARHDEVARWTTALATSGVPCREIDLASVRRIAALDATETITIPAPPAALAPPPAGRSHAEYGAVLEVPPVRPGHGAAAATHLWYLVESVDVLHALLSLHIGTWGQLETLARHNGADLLADLPAVLPRARALAGALATMHELSRVGRGRRVDRAALLASPVSSSTKLNDVIELAESAEVDGHAGRLLEALRDKRIKSFHTKLADDLERDLEDRGFLDRREPLSADEIRTAMLTSVSGEMRAGHVAADDVFALLRRIERGACDRAGDGARDASSEHGHPPVAVPAYTPIASGAGLPR